MDGIFFLYFELIAKCNYILEWLGLFLFFELLIFLNLKINPLKTYFLRSKPFSHASRTDIAKQHYHAGLVNVTTLFSLMGLAGVAPLFDLIILVSWQDKIVTPVM